MFYGSADIDFELDVMLDGIDLRVAGHAHAERERTPPVEWCHVTGLRVVARPEIPTLRAADLLAEDAWLSAGPQQEAIAEVVLARLDAGEL